MIERAIDSVDSFSGSCFSGKSDENVSREGRLSFLSKDESVFKMILRLSSNLVSDAEIIKRDMRGSLFALYGDKGAGGLVRAAVTSNINQCLNPSVYIMHRIVERIRSLFARRIIEELEDEQEAERKPAKARGRRKGKRAKKEEEARNDSVGDSRVDLNVPLNQSSVKSDTDIDDGKETENKSESVVREEAMRKRRRRKKKGSGKVIVIEEKGEKKRRRQKESEQLLKSETTLEENSPICSVQEGIGEAAVKNALCGRSVLTKDSWSSNFRKERRVRTVLDSYKAIEQQCVKRLGGGEKKIEGLGSAYFSQRSVFTNSFPLAAATSKISRQCYSADQATVLRALHSKLLRDLSARIQRIEGETRDLYRLAPFAIARLSDVLKKSIKSELIELKPFGSYVNGLLTPASDIDLLITGCNFNSEETAFSTLDILSHNLGLCSFVRKVELFHKASVPIIKVVVDLASPYLAHQLFPDSPLLNVDIILDRTDGNNQVCSALRSSSFIGNCIKSFPVFKDTYLFVKDLLSSRGLSSTHKG